MSINVGETIANPVNVSASLATLTFSSGVTHPIDGVNNNPVNVSAGFDSLALAGLTATIGDDEIIRPAAQQMSLSAELPEVIATLTQSADPVDATLESLNVTSQNPEVIGGSIITFSLADVEFTDTAGDQTVNWAAEINAALPAGQETISHQFTPALPTGVTFDLSSRVLTFTDSVGGVTAAQNYDLEISTANASAEADWQSRISGTGVVWYHDFRSDSEVDNFRWQNGFGNDVNDVFQPGRCIRNTALGITGGGCLELKHLTGVNNAPGWWRPFSALTASGNGRASDDPGANGTLTIHPDWDPTNTSMNGNWGRSYYAAQSEIDSGAGGFTASDFDGTEFYLQFRYRVTAGRYAAGNASLGGKICFIATTKNTPNQELVFQNMLNRVWLWYTNIGSSPDTGGSLGEPGFTGKQIGGEYESCNFQSSPYPGCWLYVPNEWVTFMVHVVPGTNLNPDTNLRVYVAREGQTSYETVFFKANNTIQFSAPGTHPRGYNAFQPSNYMNNQNANTAWSQYYDQIILSKNFIPCPQV